MAALGGGILVTDGSAVAPTVGFGDDTDSGLYRIGADNVGLSIGGTKRWDFATAGSTLTGTLTVSGAVTLQSTAAVTGTLTVTGATLLQSTVGITGALTLGASGIVFSDATTLVSSKNVGAKLTKNATQAINNNTWTAITMPTETWDDLAGHSLASNTSRYVFKRTGRYIVIGQMHFAASGTGVRSARLYTSGAWNAGDPQEGPIPGDASSGNLVNVMGVLVCTVADDSQYAELWGLQTSGGALNAETSCTLVVSYLGPVV